MKSNGPGTVLALPLADLAGQCHPCRGGGSNAGCRESRQIFGLHSPASLWDMALQPLGGGVAGGRSRVSPLFSRRAGKCRGSAMLGVLHFQLGQAGEGLELLDAAIAIDDRSAPVHSHRGLILAALGRAGEAVQAYRAALALNPNMADTHNNLGSLLQTAGDLAGAIEAYRRAVAIRPELVEAAVNLGLALTQAHEHAEAVVVLERAAAFAPATRQLPAISRRLITTWEQRLKRRKSAEALAAYHRAWRISPRFPWRDPTAIVSGELASTTKRFANTGRLSRSSPTFRRPIIISALPCSCAGSSTKRSPATRWGSASPGLPTDTEQSRQCLADWRPA